MKPSSGIQGSIHYVLQMMIDELSTQVKLEVFLIIGRALPKLLSLKIDKLSKKYSLLKYNN